MVKKPITKLMNAVARIPTRLGITPHIDPSELPPDIAGDG
jgi:hypothetical protein